MTRGRDVTEARKHIPLAAGRCYRHTYRRGPMSCSAGAGCGSTEDRRTLTNFSRQQFDGYDPLGAQVSKTSQRWVLIPPTVF